MRDRRCARYRRLIRCDRSTPDVLRAAVRAAAAGDEDAVRVLYRWLNPSLLRYLRFYTGAAAEDLVSEVWVAAARTLRSFDGGPAELRALLFAVARRRAVDHYRRKARAPELVALDAVVDLAGHEDTERAGLERLTTEQAVGDLVRDLPAEQAEVVLLRVLGGLDVAEVARLLGKSPVAVRVAQHRALHRLRNIRRPHLVTR